MDIQGHSSIQSNLENEISSVAESEHVLTSQAIGRVSDISGSSSQIIFSAQSLANLAPLTDACLSMSGQVGSQVKVRVGSTWLTANVRTLREGEKTGEVIALVDFLGEGDEERLTGKLFNFRRGVTRYPAPGALVYPVSTDDMKQMYAADDRPHIEVGNVYPTKNVRGALFVDAMLGKHFALLGSTGTGKSTSAALILHKICELAPQGHIVMIDPHGEYASAFSTNGALFDVNNLAMPYWMMNFEEHCEVFLTTTGNERQKDADILAKCLLAARAKHRTAEGIAKLTVDAPIPYLLSDLLANIQAELGKLDKANDNAPYMRLRSKIDEIRNDPRYSFMFSGMMVSDSMAEFLGRIFRLPTDGKPISIIDVSGVPSDITSVVVAVLARTVFDYAIWSRNEPQRPILLVCEEAHRYVPNEINAQGSSVGKILGRIAKEGRKYGVSLGLITQRPSDLAEGVLSQCGTIIAMRLNNERDQAFVKAAMPEGARGFLDTIPALRNRECIMCGEGVAIPIRVSFDDLAPNKRPASEDPSFAQLWTKTGGEEEIIGRVIKRWRAQSK